MFNLLAWLSCCCWFDWIKTRKKKEKRPAALPPKRISFSEVSQVVRFRLLLYTYLTHVSRCRLLNGTLTLGHTASIMREGRVARTSTAGVTPLLARAVSQGVIAGPLTRRGTNRPFFPTSTFWPTQKIRNNIFESVTREIASLCWIHVVTARTLGTPGK